MATPSGDPPASGPGPNDMLLTFDLTSFRPNLLIVDEATSDDNSVATLNLVTIQSLQLFRGYPIIVRRKKRRYTVLICQGSDDVEEGRIQVNKVVRNNLRVKLGDLVSVRQCFDITHGKRVHILPFDDSVKGLSGNIFDVFLEPYFLHAYRPVRRGDTFLVRGGMRTVEFKVMETDPAEYCIVGPNTVIFFEGDPVKREDEELNLRPCTDARAKETPTCTPVTPVKAPHSPTGSFFPPPESPPSAEEPRDVNSKHESMNDPVQLAAEKFKEHGNDLFKRGRYDEAVDLYTKAIDLVSTEPTYLTNRAAAYIAIKRFRPALTDCLLATSLQTTPTGVPAPPQTLLRLARCHLALAQTTAALSTLRDVLDAEPGSAPAVQMQARALELEKHVRNLKSLKRSGMWERARVVLDQCLLAIEAEGSELPAEWRLWQVEIELARANWDGADSAANDALRLQSSSPDVLALRGLVFFLSGRLPQALQDAQSALRFDPGHEPAQRLRKRVKEVEWFKEEGNQVFKLGKWQEALSMYANALELVGEREDEGKGGRLRALLLSNRATTLVKLSRHDDALVDIEACLLLQQGLFKALRTRARIRLHKEQYEGAISDFRAALKQAELESAAVDMCALQTELRCAEETLERIETKDYYTVLGVPRDCTEADIKKAYRRQSLKHHPDKGGKAERFRLIVEAHGVLSDPWKRERYNPEQ